MSVIAKISFTTVSFYLDIDDRIFKNHVFTEKLTKVLNMFCQIALGNETSNRERLTTDEPLSKNKVSPLLIYSITHKVFFDISRTF